MTAKQESRLPESVKSNLERDFKEPLNGVRIHAGEEGERIARENSALAVSKGANIYFGAGAYAPGTERGNRILRHEVTHYLQRRAVPHQNNTVWPKAGLEAEADLAATKARGPVDVRGNAVCSQALNMKTFVSTVGGNPYLDNAVKFYKLWENETASRVGSYQEIVNKLATQTKPLPEFRIVAHANGLNLFLPLLAGAKSYAELPALGLQTRKALATKFGDIAHPTSDMTGEVHGWLKSTPTGRALFGKLGLTTAVRGIWKELIWWVVDEHFAKNVKEDAVARGGPKATKTLERKALRGEIINAQAAIKAAAQAALPSTAKKTDVDKLRTEVLAAFVAQSWKWGKVPAGYLKKRLVRLRHKDVVALRKEVQTGTFVKKLATVKSWISKKTYIEVRGCNIGSNDAYLNGIRELFGTKPGRLPSISAPKLYQFFGRPGVLVLPPGRKAPAIAKSLKFLFEEKFDDASLAKDVERAVKAAKLTSLRGLAQVLRYADIKAEFDTWWKMKQKAKGVAAASLKSATLKDFQNFLTATPGRAFPVNAPGLGAESLWYFILLPSTAIDAILAWIKDQGYTLPGGADPLKTFFGGRRKFRAGQFIKGMRKIVVDWLGDQYPVPDKIYFREDPEYTKNIRKLP